MPKIQINTQTITQITVVDAEPERQAEALSMMAERARFMARQPGFVSISLHRSLDGRRIVNYVQWQNRELLQQAHQSPDFRNAWEKFDDLTDQIDPHLYEVAEVLEVADLAMRCLEGERARSRCRSLSGIGQSTMFFRSHLAAASSQSSKQCVGRGYGGFR